MTHNKKQQQRHYIWARWLALPWKKITVTAVIVTVTILLVSAIQSYNRMAVLRTDTQAQWQQVETQYQRRLDLVPNLLITVEAAQVQERSVLVAVSEARNRYNEASNSLERVDAANQLDLTLQRLLIVVEAYPQLQSNDLVKNFQIELVTTENKISAERIRYNNLARQYNSYIQVFPRNSLAAVFSFKKSDYFNATLAANAAPMVKQPDAAN